MRRRSGLAVDAQSGLAPNVGPEEEPHVGVEQVHVSRALDPFTRKLELEQNKRQIERRQPRPLALRALGHGHSDLLA